MRIKQATALPPNFPITHCPPADKATVRAAAKKRYQDALERERWSDVDAKARRAAGSNARH